MSQPELEEQIRKEPNNRIKYVLLQELAREYSSEGNFEPAFQSYQKALRIAGIMRKPKLECEALISLGETSVYLDNIYEAAHFYKQALGIARKRRDLRTQSYILGKLASISTQLHEYDKAAEYFEEATNSARSRRARVSPIAIGEGITAHRGWETQYFEALETTAMEEVSDSVREVERLRRIETLVVFTSSFLLLFVSLKVGYIILSVIILLVLIIIGLRVWIRQSKIKEI